MTESAPRDKFKNTWEESIGDFEYFEEAAEEGLPKRTLRLTILKAGFSGNLHEARRGRKYYRFYPNATVERAAPLAEGLPIYVGNSADHFSVRRLEDRVGTLRNVDVIESGGFKAIRGDLKVLPHKDWVLELAKDDPKAFGPSIEACGEVRCPAHVDGKPSAIVESIEKLRAALLVENPAAGGGINEIYESEGGEPMKLEELTEAERAEVMKEARDKVFAELDVQAKDDKINELEEAAKEDRAKITELESEINEAKSVSLVEAAFPKAKEKNAAGVEVEVDVLPEPTRKRLLESLKGKTDEKEIKEAVDEAVKEVEAILEAQGKKPGAPVNAGAGTPPDEGESTELTEAKKDIDEGFGVKEEASEEDKK